MSSSRRITLDEAKQYLRVDSSDEDALIENIIQSAHNLVLDVCRKEESDLEDSDAPLVYIIEAGNDSCDYREVATQEDFNSF